MIGPAKPTAVTHLGRPTNLDTISQIHRRTPPPKLPGPKNWRVTSFPSRLALARFRRQHPLKLEGRPAAERAPFALLGRACVELRLTTAGTARIQAFERIGDWSAVNGI